MSADFVSVAVAHDRNDWSQRVCIVWFSGGSSNAWFVLMSMIWQGGEDGGDAGDLKETAT